MLGSAARLSWRLLRLRAGATLLRFRRPLLNGSKHIFTHTGWAGSVTGPDDNAWRKRRAQPDAGATGRAGAPGPPEPQAQAAHVPAGRLRAVARRRVVRRGARGQAGSPPCGGAGGHRAGPGHGPTFLGFRGWEPFRCAGGWFREPMVV